jgi:hypothetical protein
MPAARTRAPSPSRSRAGGWVFPSWSPDSKQIAFIPYHQQGSDGTLWITSADGFSQSQVLPTGPFAGPMPGTLRVR